MGLTSLIDLQLFLIRLVAQNTYAYMKAMAGTGSDISDPNIKARCKLARHALKTKRYEETHNTKDQNYNNAHDIEETRAIAREKLGAE